MTRLAYRVYRLASSIRHHVARRFTPAGVLMLGAVLASGALGLDFDQTVAYQILALTASLLTVSGLAAACFRDRFTAERSLPRFASVGQPFRYQVQVSSRSTKAVPGLQMFEDLADPRPRYEEFLRSAQPPGRQQGVRLRAPALRPVRARRARSQPAAVPPMPPAGRTEVQVEMIPLKRGPLRFDSITIARPDPLGLVRGLVRIPAPQTLIVLPKRYPLSPLAVTGSRAYQRGGVALASAIGESEEFVSLRDYRPGDPLRRIHWQSTARTGRPIVKEFQDEFLVRQALILDTFAGATSGAAFEEAVSVAASFTCMIRTQESLLDLMFVGPKAICFTTGRGLGQAEQALEILAVVRPCLHQQFTSLRLLVRQHARTVSSCVCVLLDWDEPRQELVRELRGLSLPVLVLVVADPAAAPSLLARRNQTDTGGFHLLEAGKIAEGLQALQRTIG